ncbi:hypothetical protein SAMN05216225_10806 [Ornithinibacillus halophilus]|uniref:Uncharacterized protein n=1 Tax=Ornithinibacillus halophilus TaxID=930117 RepID=A0A1M5NHR4_9BACI|nr:hypothetical protein SAMN05216225_10806 [Ornithinibacillus halophilus]
MWQMILERLPSTLGWFYIILSFLLPFLVYKVNQNLHKNGDPPWKKEG